jgi:hypothetical protein
MRKVNLHLMLPLDDMISPLGKWMSVTDEMILGHSRFLPWHCDSSSALRFRPTLIERLRVCRCGR